MNLVLDAYGRPVLHPGDVIAMRDRSDGPMHMNVREPLRVTRIMPTSGDSEPVDVTPPQVCDCSDCGPAETYRIYFKEAMSSREEWMFAHDIEVKLLARADRDGL